MMEIRLVGTKAREVRAIRDAELPSHLLQSSAKRAVSNEHNAKRRPPGHQERHRPQESRMILDLDEPGDVANHQRIRGNPELQAKGGRGRRRWRLKCRVVHEIRDLENA